MIPKRIHQIWIGEVEMPGRWKVWCQTVKKAHPDWEYTLWTNNKVEKIKAEMPSNILEKYNKFYDSKVFALAADVLRFWVVYKYGGVGLDCDFKMQPNGNLNMLPLNNNLILTNMRPTVPGQPLKCRLQNCFYAATPEYPFMKTLVDRLGNQNYEILTAERKPMDKYNCQYLTTEYLLYINPSYSKKLPIFAIEDLSIYKLPEKEVILDTSYFLERDSKIAFHFECRSHAEKNRKKFTLDGNGE